MTDFTWLLAFGAGVALAALYLFALWQTVRLAPRVRHPGLLVLASLALRLALVMAAFAGLAQTGRWEYLVAALGGFLLVRALVVRRFRLQIESEKEEATT
ncbi:MAG: ATP synthase subunit I [Planctomycetota bacterium]